MMKPKTYSVLLRCSALFTVEVEASSLAEVYEAARSHMSVDVPLNSCADFDFDIIEIEELEGTT